MAIDIVDYDQDIIGLKEYLTDFLKGKVICDNMKSAYKLRSKNLDGLKEIYTLDGNILRKDGTISAHGNPDSIKKIYKYNTKKSSIYQDLQSLKKEQGRIETELNGLKYKFD